MPLKRYVAEIQKRLQRGDATEPTYYSALEALLEEMETGITVTNEPKRIECGAPDFIVTRGAANIGCVEAKVVGSNLDREERSEQMERYRDSLSNLILTDFLEFRWYVDGKQRAVARLGTATRDGNIKADKAGMEVVRELLSNFLAHRMEAIGTAKDLAQRMAHLAHVISDIVIEAFDKQLASASLQNLHKAFCETLIPNLPIAQFADMYAQTIAYGLFAARCNDKGPALFTRQSARDLIPSTNPFLQKLFYHDIAGPDLDDRIAWLVDDLAQLLDRADMEAILKDFGKRTAKEDPVVHFYETFLAAYDPKVREMRGVYYTPEPVVSYIVRSIDHLLKTRFNKPQGLADPSVLILDPAVGTATFLYDVVKLIYEAMQDQMGMWQDYVAERLLPRLFGFELLMAPYAVAHLKLGLLLKETGYQFTSDQRLGIYLTNTLEEAIKRSETIFAAWITQEANAAAQIKKELPIMVVLGNPPYSGISANRGEWITQLIGSYKQVDGKPLGERKVWLQDDYVKFIRFGQWRIERTGQGILGFITNHAYLDNPTFRGMRQSLMNSFTDIYILDLHGSAKKRETAPNGGKDENVFDIQQGVAIGLFVKELGKAGPAKVHHAHLWGPRGEWPNPQPGTKYYTLSETDITTTDWVELQPNSPFYFFVPREEGPRPEYETGWKVTDIFPVNCTGIVTARDEFVIDFEPAPIRQRLEMFLDKNLGDVEVKEKLSLSENYAWRVSEARKQLMTVGNWQSLFTNILYRPFDIRSIYYHPSVVWRTRSNVMRHMLAGDNVGLITVRQVAEGIFDHALVTKAIVESRITLSNKGIGFVFPLYLYPAEGEMQFKEGRRRHNLNPQFIKIVSDKLGLKFAEDGKGDLEKTFGPEDIFYYAYAIFHSPTYRTRYEEFLKIDFPRLPLTSDRRLFTALVEKGAALVALHLMESPTLETPIIGYPIRGSNEVVKVRYVEPHKEEGEEIPGRVYINKEQYFEGVEPEVWGFHIGGYQVLNKWLKDRRGRKLSITDSEHYQKIVVALKETMRLMEEIDGLIPSWPLK